MTDEETPPHDGSSNEKPQADGTEGHREDGHGDVNDRASHDEGDGDGVPDRVDADSPAGPAIEPTKYTAVVDRHEGDLAVLVLERDGRAVDQLVLDVDRLPPAGRAPDSVLSVTVAGGEVVEITHRADETDRRRESASDRFSRLSRRLRDSGPDEPDGDDDTEHA